MQAIKYLYLISLVQLAYAVPINKPIAKNSLKINSAPFKEDKYIRPDDNLFSKVFDFTYSGEVLGIPYALKEFDSSLRILSPLGHKQLLIVNLDLPATTLTDIAQAIQSQTEGKVTLLYDNKENTLRLSFTQIMDIGQNAIEESLKWQHGQFPKPILSADGIVRFPYGQYQPIITCQPLNLCDIELQAGEEIQSILIGDSVRWNEGDQGIPVVYSGFAPKLVPHLVLKPSQGGLETSLMITTSKRSYMLKLRSAFSGYVAQAGFYYPAELIERFVNKKALSVSNSNQTISTNSEIKMPLIDLTTLNYNYTIKGDDYPWKPKQVFDDGTSVYIRLPNEVDAEDLPGLCVLVNNSSDKCEMVNFRYNNHFYMVDKLFNQAKLINGYGNTQQEVTLTRNPPQKGFWARLFGN